MPVQLPQPGLTLHSGPLVLLGLEGACVGRDVGTWGCEVVAAAELGETDPHSWARPPLLDPCLLGRVGCCP